MKTARTEGRDGGREEHFCNGRSQKKWKNRKSCQFGSDLIRCSKVLLDSSEYADK